jgi:hypothetical protein
MNRKINGYGLGAVAGAFAGGYMGASFGAAAGIMFGGITNTVGGIFTGNVTDAYSLSQHFVGGALSGYAGHSFATSKAMSIKYMKKKGANKFFQYGLQATASDFAYDKDRKFLDKNLGQHFGTFTFGGLGGLMQMHAFNNDWVRQSKDLGRLGLSFGLSVLGYGSEYIGTSFVKGNYHGLYTKGWTTKAGVSGFKSLMYSLTIK